MNRFLFSYLILLIPFFATARQIPIGSGSGGVNKNDMTGLRAGDTLAIRAGFYEAGGSFSHLSGITIINARGAVQFGNTITLNALSKVSLTGTGTPGLLYGFVFNRMNATVFLFEGPCRELTVAQCIYTRCEKEIFNVSHTFIKYTGDSATFALYRVRITGQKLSHCGPLFSGPYGGTPTFENVSDSVSFTHVIVDSTESEGPQVLSASMYRMLVSDWHVTGPAPNAHRDLGLIQTNGNGTVRNFFRHGGWGYIWRNWNVGLNGRSESWIYNCIDLGSAMYGTLDTRIDPADTTTGTSIPFTRGGNMHVFHNTTGNKRVGAYVSVLAVVGQFYSENGYHVEIRNNLCFNNVTDNANTLEKQNTQDKLTDTSNNIYVKDAIAAGILLDTVDCRLNPKGPAVNGGVTVAHVRVDFGGVARPVGDAPDIGARECPHPGSGAGRAAVADPTAPAGGAAPGGPAQPATADTGTPAATTGPADWKNTALTVAVIVAAFGGLAFTAGKVFRKPKGRSTRSPRETQQRHRS